MRLCLYLCKTKFHFDNHYNNSVTDENLEKMLKFNECVYK